MTDSDPATTPREVMIVAGEASGDLHGANLVRAMREQSPELRFYGMGGIELERAGVELLYDAAKLAVVGAVEVFSHLPDILRARRILIARLRHQRPALLILIDYPDFNLMLAKVAKQLGIPVFYYISPQVWAWRSGRVQTIKKRTDRMAVILPFEQAFYAEHGMQVDFVGHPLLDNIQPTCTPAQFKAQHHIDPLRPVIGLIPGSRRKEVAVLLPEFLAAAGLLSAAHPQPIFLLAQAPTIDTALLREHGLDRWQQQLDLRVITEDRYAMMAACDVAVAASGTVTLELAILDTPTVAAYRISPHTYWLGRLLIRGLPFFTLVNLIADQAILPELLQSAVTPQRIAQEVSTLLNNAQARSNMLTGLKEVRQRLGGPGASKRAAAIAFSLLNTRRQQNGYQS
ncbi:lipid-A-disaccharide synthase [Desulfobulbus oligotrophicus]|uniref:lipid-A-disaccharide synthase n=1 Tax=Desulfobulbus oligotrophicus TaxID=1909699 RepID=UPI001E4F5D8F|nr:lipid-A-disaccharide synthase [Desulfobulbus oligotrophicus]MDY0390607.1 lipid-A-disaccharide synthase [Desulfobulbus oligotrophicus]